ncbi:MAG: prepilin-type N-terminal cleavage/methylation domain-containing protein [Acidobacteria bacterium]|nr:prepilin-type N-terminal cleavage/methylation domain-containing protein [Acidobacteriota bacterium]
MPRQSIRRRSEAGMTLIETMLALVILFIVAAGLMGLAVVATVTTENQGHLSARTAEYAQDKMEQLMSLAYGDFQSDTISPNCVLYLVNPNCVTGAAGLAVGGSLNFAAPVNNYVDYLDSQGNPLGGGAVPPATWFYQRVWIITNPDLGAGPDLNLKQITVSCRTRFQVGTQKSANVLASTLTSLKTNPF